MTKNSSALRWYTTNYYVVCITQKSGWYTLQYDIITNVGPHYHYRFSNRLLLFIDMLTKKKKNNCVHHWKQIYFAYTYLVKMCTPPISINIKCATLNVTVSVWHCNARYQMMAWPLPHHTMARAVDVNGKRMSWTLGTKVSRQPDRRWRIKPTDMANI